MMIFNEESYRPLIEGLTIRESEIDGLGLYATMDFGKDYQFGVSHFLDRRGPGLGWLSAAKRKRSQAQAQLSAGAAKRSQAQAQLSASAG